VTSDHRPRLLRDIESQPESLATVLSHQLGRGHDALVEAARRVAEARRVVITGIGASMMASIPFEHRLCAAGIDATIVESGELLHYPRPLPRGTLVVVVSRSGESIEIARLLPHLRDRCTTLGVTNDPESSLARGVDHLLEVRSLADEMVAIQSYTGTWLALQLVAARSVDELTAAAGAAQEAIDWLPRFIREGVERLTHWDALFAAGAPIHLVARGPSLGSALEGALLFNETARLPAVGMAATSFRHGPAEIVDHSFAGLVFAPATATRPLNLALARDLAGFGGRVRVIGPRLDDLSGLDCYDTPEVPEWLAPLFEVVPVQLAALRLAQLRGVPVGQFRHVPQVSQDEASFPSRDRGTG
jgi:glucosamine--fructose-6-phosphate aminotransferase (isomerizing)